MRLFFEQVAAAAGADLELVTVPDEALPPDLRITGTISQHLLVSPSRAREVLGWQAAADRRCCAARSPGISVTRRATRTPISPPMTPR